MALDQENISKDILVDCLTQQLSEYELLKSMYPGPGEIVLSENHTIKEIKDYIEKKVNYIPSILDFKLKLIINNFKLELFINLPRSYPKEEPDIYVRCNKLNRYSESKLNLDLTSYIKENHNGEVCLYTAVAWLQENIDLFTVNIQKPVPVEAKEPQNKEDEYARLWIFSHHIYNKRKREEIVSQARAINLTGFLVPGKPGIICVEGKYSDCDVWWKDIKSMNWKKIMIRRTETFKSSEEKTFRKFPNFEELNSSMSDLAKYMNELGLSHIYNDFFKLCNVDIH